MARISNRPALRRIVTVNIGVAMFLCTPYFLYRHVAFQFGADELRAAVEGTWEIGIPGPSGSRSPGDTTRHTVVIRQGMEAPSGRADRGLIRSASACSHRTLIRSAEACLDATEVPLELRALGEAGPFGTGVMVVYGRKFSGASLTLQFAGREINAHIDPLGHVIEIRTREGAASVTLRRLSRSPGGEATGR